MTIQLYPMMAPINRKELANHNSNLERITTGLTHLQYQINVLAGGEDVELLLQRIEQATNNAVNATTLTNEATMAAIEATNQASQATTQTIEATDKAEQATILANEMLQAMATQMDEAEEAIQAALQATTEAIEAKQKAEVATMASEQATDKTKEATEQAVIITTQAEQATNQAISAAEQAMEVVDEATQVLTKIDGIMTQFQFVGTYDNTTTYQPYNAVLYQGSTFLALQITTNQPPPTLPVTANEHWQLVAQRGIDGKGAVATVNGMPPDTEGNVDLGEIIKRQDMQNHIEKLANASESGHVLIDNKTIKVDENGKIYSALKIQQDNAVVLSGNKSSAIGRDVIALGEDSLACGLSAKATGLRSISLGMNTESSQLASVALCMGTKAEGSFSLSANRITTANVYRSFVIGQLNKLLNGEKTIANATDDVFVIGNGAKSTELGNAFRVTHDGKTFGLSAFNSTGADYAEYFEWLDGNTKNEDRVALFVTLDGEKIRLANNDDEYILGIVSAHAAIIGDSHDDDWKNKYVTDLYGRFLTEDVTVTETEYNENGEKVEVTRVENHFKINPHWNETDEYIPRSERKEWAAIGMLGKLYLHDDGTCITNGYASPKANGIATKATFSKFRVMKRITNNLIKVLVLG